ncbi:receptor-type tyrosine-protein phosphatase T-like isoform X2 [Haliotis asinina]|uniref:receptor-type tyrosine-protein phosphatase T-like isoform X2 n=1 Tax=Haliotis asinina TaxID=109174 RepID=UPI0035325D25
MATCWIKRLFFLSCLIINASAGSHGNNCVNGVCRPHCVNVTPSGECLQCLDSRFYGKQCQHDCPDTCLSSCCQLNNTRVVCTEGCVVGRKGDNCAVPCPGACTHCERYGDACTGPCQSPQYYGPHCNTSCPSNCTGGCNRVTGECGSCEPGYTGDKCDVTCPPNCRGGCDNETGECISHDMLSVGVLTTLAVIICLAVAACVTLRRLKLKLTREATRRLPISQNANPTVSLDDISEASDLSTVNPLYEHTGAVLNLPHIKMCPELQEDSSVEQMVQEFRNLPASSNKASHCGRLTENMSKNRYQDILPFDTTRVCLTVEKEDQSDYINASYIDGYRNQSEYIATQGPQSHLMLDFWRMVWQVEATKIVMLTRLVEAGFVKCDKYWPCCSIDCKTYGDVSVQCIEERVFEHYTTRQFAVWKANSQTRKIHHLHYTSWPAHCVPDEVTSLIDFYKVVKNTDADEEGPTVVHCSAGVGRTGTFLALGHLIEQSRYEGQACVFACVQGFRLQRMNMVNTVEQYILLYRALIEALKTRGILPDNCRPVWLQCQRCWENVPHQPVCNGVLMRPVANRPANAYGRQEAV